MPNEAAAQTPGTEQAGDRPVGDCTPEEAMYAWQRLLIGVYYVVLSLWLLFLLVQLWPPPKPFEAGSQPPHTPRASARGVVLIPPRPGPGLRFATLWRSGDELHGFWLNDEESLLLIVAVAGALGALLHSVRSYYWYAGHGCLQRRWLAMYLFLPFSGAVLGLVVYLAIRGGFLAASTRADQTNAFGCAAAAALSGLFSQQFVLKLKQIAEVAFSAPPPGANAVPQGTFALSVTPATQTARAGTPAVYAISVTLAGGSVGPIGISAASLPPTSTHLSSAALSPPTSSQATLTIDTTGLAAGSYTITVTAQTGSLSRTAQAALVVS